MNPPEPLSHFRAYFLACVTAAFFLGTGCVLGSIAWHSLALFAPTFLIIPATYGVIWSIRELALHFRTRIFLKENPNLPVSITMDGDYAMITTLDGSLISLPVPDEVREAGPQAVMSYVVESLED